MPARAVCVKFGQEGVTHRRERRVGRRERRVGVISRRIETGGRVAGGCHAWMLGESWRVLALKPAMC